ncbi:hypothetical protein [Listeria sp. ILCC797]|uniref:hypothetical protein n=1 Tax=Listeria sp. ILCC797 TaxID=1918333 RepID=UPI000B5888A3|nr:hypothetical protein [Listeria sp. ILCC797]
MITLTWVQIVGVLSILLIYMSFTFVLVKRALALAEENEGFRGRLREYKLKEGHEFMLKITDVDDETLGKLKKEWAKGRVIIVKEEDLENERD